VLSERFSDHFRDGDPLFLRAAKEAFFHLWIETDRLDNRGLRAESGSAPLAPPGDELVDVVAALGFGGEFSMRSSVIGVPDFVCP
jgi:hypothetical protein